MYYLSGASAIGTTGCIIDDAHVALRVILTLESGAVDNKDILS